MNDSDKVNEELVDSDFGEVSNNEEMPILINTDTENSKILKPKT